MLKIGNDCWPPHVAFTPEAESIVAANVELVLQGLHIAKRQPVPLGGFGCNLLKPDAFDLAVRALEEHVDQFRLEANRIENLRPAIGLVGRNAHLRHNLEDALRHRLDVALYRVVDGERRVERRQHRFDRFEREIGVDRFRAVTGKRAELVHLVGLASFNHEADRGPEPPADQAVVDGRCREQGGNRNPVRRDIAIRQDDDVVAFVDRRFRFRADIVDGRLHAFRALGSGIGDFDRRRPERIVLDVADLANALQLLVGQDRLRNFQPLLFSVPFKSRRFGLGPIKDTRLITSSSRIGSIGGLVTCAKFCLK